jgi:cytochrome c peroxidase
MRQAVALLAVAAAAAEGPPLGLDRYIPAPSDNPITEKAVALGRKLFHDKRLSRDSSISCATCHDPQHGFADGKPLAVGIAGRKGSRRVPTIINRAYGKSFFWDGRTAALEEQVLQPVLNPLEMDLKAEEIARRVGLEPPAVAKALASYVRTILAGDSAYDRYVAGDQTALTEEARSGLEVFRTKGNCISCHLGPNLTDEAFHNTGTAWNGSAFSDPGRFEATHKQEDRGAFKTPTLREVANRPPYMHDGSLRTLEDVVEFYDKGGRRNPNLDSEIRPLNLTAEEKSQLLAFLHSLSGIIRH